MCGEGVASNWSGEQLKGGNEQQTFFQIEEPSRDLPSQTRWQPPAGCLRDTEIGSAR